MHAFTAYRALLAGHELAHVSRMNSTITTAVLLCLAAACGPKDEPKSAESSPVKRAVIVVTSHGEFGDTGKRTGWYLSEVSHVYYPLIESGYEVDFASPKGGAAPMDEGSRKPEDPDNARLLGDPVTMQRLERTLPLSELDPSNYQLVHFAGGHGAMWDFPANPDVNRLAAGIYERGGIVAAVCHGPAAFVDVKLSSDVHLVHGHDVAAFTNAEEREVGGAEIVPFLLQSKLEERGAKVLTAPNWQSQVVVSGRLVTGQNPQSGHALGRALQRVSRDVGTR